MSTDYYEEPRPEIAALVTKPGARVLDVGCGGGALGASLKQHGAAYVAGIELHPDAVAAARVRLDKLVQGSVLDSELPFAEGEFDYLVFADVLEHLPDSDRALQRCLPFLKQDGIVIVSVPNYRFYWVLLRLMLDRWEYTESGVRDRTHLRIFTRHNLLTMLQHNGLVLERLHRNFRVLEDQSQIGRLGALVTRIANATIAPLLFPNLMAYQYIAVARRR
jgi:2-polyprenyl-3-methyl-5-hydroxy-6-metoxy-1,4-benzoquinol methylase